MPKWIGNGVLKIKAGTFIKYGDEIPKDYPKARVTELKAQGLIGDIVEAAKATPFDDKGLEALQGANKALMDTNAALTDESLKVIADKDFVLAAFEFLQDVIVKIEKTEPNREIRKILDTMEG